MIENINECIRIMKESVDDKYCQSYINELPECIEYGTDGLIMQLSYILANLSQWKGPSAKEVKTFIRKWIKDKSGSR